MSRTSSPILAGHSHLVATVLVAGAVTGGSGAAAAEPAQAERQADAVSAEALAAPRPDAPAIFLNLAPATGVGVVSADAHAAVLAGAGLGLRLGEASGEMAMHVGTGAFARHYNVELQGRYYSTPATYLIGLLQYGWATPATGERAYANATAFVGFGAMLGGSRHCYAELALGTGNAWITDAAGAKRSVFEARAQLRVGWALGRFSPARTAGGATAP